MFHWRRHGSYELETVPCSQSDLEKQKYTWISLMDITQISCGKALEQIGGHLLMQSGTFYVPVCLCLPDPVLEGVAYVKTLYLLLKELMLCSAKPEHKKDTTVPEGF